MLREFKAAGVATFAFAGPLLPGNPERLAALLAGAVDRVLIDRMNYVPAVRGFYARHGLLDALTDSFFRTQSMRLTARSAPAASASSWCFDRTRRTAPRIHSFNHVTKRGEY